jgi:signal transduction histidine kinase
MAQEAFDREHRRVIETARAAGGAGRGDAERLTAVLDVARQLSEERNMEALLNRVCAEARDLTLARHAVVGLLPSDGVAAPQLFTSGIDTHGAADVPEAVGGDLGFEAVIKERRPLRIPRIGDAPAVLRVPIASTHRVYGWLSLRNKIGTDEFSDADAAAAVTLGTHAGVAYENAQALDDLSRRLDDLGSTPRPGAPSVRQALDQERARLARALHDELGQELAGLKMDLHWMRTQVAPAPTPPGTDVAHRVETMMGSLERLIQSVRSIASDLRPAVLDQLGFVAAIESHAAEWERQTGLRCQVGVSGAGILLDRDAATAALRVVQEALSNVQRHARATHAAVSITRTAQVLTITVADDGRGISEQDAVSRESLGLIGMRERADLLGGTLAIGRRRSGGTAVTLTVPVSDGGPRPRGVS